MEPRRNFFSLLFDMSFGEFVTPRNVRAVYGISMFASVAAAVV